MNADADTEIVYRHIPDGTGRIEVPGRLVEDYGHTWNIRCYVWGGAEYYYLARHTPAPTAARAYGVRDGHRRPSTADRIREWLEEQAEAMATYQRAHPAP